MSDRDDLAELTSAAIKCNTLEDTIEDIVMVIVILLSSVFALFASQDGVSD